MCTMRRLFKRETDVATVRAIQQGDVPDPRTFDKDFPEALWRIIERALQHDRDKRYPSAGAMANDLDMFLGLARLQTLRARLARLVTDALSKEEPKPAPEVEVEKEPELDVPDGGRLPPKPPEEASALSASLREPPAVTATRDVVVFVLVGALAGLVVVALWIALVR
jgi:serine/threonine-protein kinase